MNTPLVCPECGAPDFGANCQMCVAVRSIRLVRTALDWTFEAMQPDRRVEMGGDCGRKLTHSVGIEFSPSEPAMEAGEAAHAFLKWLLIDARHYSEQELQRKYNEWRTSRKVRRAGE